ncbi:hypothetical protein TSMEX_002939, partial [Taenia solium]
LRDSEKVLVTRHSPYHYRGCQQRNLEGTLRNNFAAGLPLWVIKRCTAYEVCKAIYKRARRVHQIELSDVHVLF